MERYSQCRACNGSGMRAAYECGDCNGSGYSGNAMDDRIYTGDPSLDPVSSAFFNRRRYPKRASLDGIDVSPEYAMQVAFEAMMESLRKARERHDGKK